MNQAGLVSIVIVLLVAASGVGYLGGVENGRTITSITTVTNSITPADWCPKASDQAATAIPVYYTVKVSYAGNWSAWVSTYSSAQTWPTHLDSACFYTGSGIASIDITTFNPLGEQTIVVMAHKFDSGGNLTASVTMNGVTHSNSTTSAYGYATVYDSIGPNN